MKRHRRFAQTLETVCGLHTDSLAVMRVKASRTFKRFVTYSRFELTWANSEMPIVALSPDTLTHSWDAAYLRSAGTAKHDPKEKARVGSILRLIG